MAKEVIMKDFEGKIIKLHSRVFASWGGNKHLVGKVSGFKGNTTVIINKKDIEKTTSFFGKGAVGVEWNCKNLIVL